jgi:hypothetical protein
MSKKKLLFVTVLCFIMGFSLATPVGAKMLKEVAIGVFDNAPSQAEGDWFYLRYHGPEIVRLSAPWMTRYQLWLPYEPPEEAVALFGAVRGRYAELWYREDDYLDRPELSGITMPPFRENSTRKSGQTNVMVPANPTDVFYDSDPHPEKTSILRWITFIAYPDGVSEEAGEKWFKEVYAKEAVKQPELLKFVSHKVWKNENPDVTIADVPTGDMDMPAGMPAMKQWVRMCEYWYTDFDAWRKAVLDSPPDYTAPPWGGSYPFVDMASTFIPYYPDVDFLKGTYTPDYTAPETTFSVP